MLPFGRIELKGQKSKPFAEQPVTLGEHLRKRRLELGLFQREVAKRLRIGQFTYLSWEKDRARPEVRWWPAIIGFLGYDPHPEPWTFSEQLRARRRALGLSIAEAAQRVGVDEGTFGRWDRGVREPLGRHLGVLARFLGATPEAF